MLPRLYANFYTEEIWLTLLVVLELYPWLVTETAGVLGYPWVLEGQQTIAWVKDCFAEYAGGNSQRFSVPAQLGYNQSKFKREMFL